MTRERRLERRRANYQRNRERILATNEAWRKRNRDKVSTYEKERLHRKKRAAEVAA